MEENKKRKAGNRVDMVGKAYNSWMVLEHVETRNKIAYYKCTCMDCGTDHIVDGRNIRSGRSKQCLSCGHVVTRKRQTGKYKTGKTSKEIAEHYLYLQKRKGGKNRELAWELSKEEFVEIIYKDCTYCGLPPSTTVNPTLGHSMAESRATECFITYNGIDRIDSSKGYITGNVVPCCSHCNRAKMERSVDDYKAWLLKSVEFIKTLK